MDDKIEDDRMGRLAQRCFHIENLNGQLYHFLDFDEEKYEQHADNYKGLDPTQDPLFSLCSSGVPTKLPACDHCHTALKKRFEYIANSNGDPDSDNCPPYLSFALRSAISVEFLLRCLH